MSSANSTKRRTTKSKPDPNIDQLLTELDRQLAWFDSDEFELSQAEQRFQEVSTLAAQAETMLQAMDNRVTVLAQRFDEQK